MSKTDARLAKVHRHKSSGERLVAIFLMKSGLITSMPLENGVALNAS
ncbi:unnamed protein product, partial [Rotaria sp. Silwood2]